MAKTNKAENYFEKKKQVKSNGISITSLHNFAKLTRNQLPDEVWSSFENNRNFVVKL